MTLTGTVHRFARLRSGAHVATVTRVRPDAPDAICVYLVEHAEPTGPVFTSCATWRAALDVAASAITRASVRQWA
ncbi:hypothetical protein [Gemmatimonas sp.]|uniref:hypothetical protein n=1 Tax=Gemmatimonas sp. TaxID=1962908 RepID=UPI0025BBC091|nr:hypothetical protein [Gemmatimonas sp.]MCA2990790.1 hypothetical protein [Gemmatimonas sp.]